jgi:TolA-binding protein
MSSRTEFLQDLRLTKCFALVFLPLVLLIGLASAPAAKSQIRSPNLPGPATREGNRSMDDYDRTINRMKNDARAANVRRRNLFPQINEDFQRIQELHNQIVRMLQPGKELNYERLADLADDLRKRSSRLRENLALPAREKTETQPTHSEEINDRHMQKTIGDLHDLIVSFVANPLFKNLGVLDAKVIIEASENLDNIIDVSGEIKREAKVLSKSSKK